MTTPADPDSHVAGSPEGGFSAAGEYSQLSAQDREPESEEPAPPAGALLDRYLRPESHVDRTEYLRVLRAIRPVRDEVADEAVRRFQAGELPREYLMSVLQTFGSSQQA